MLLLMKDWNKDSNIITECHLGKKIPATRCCTILSVLLRREKDIEEATGGTQNRLHTEALYRITHQLTAENCLMKSVY